MRALLPIVIVLLGLSQAGCADLGSPTTSTTPKTPPPSKLAIAERTHEYPTSTTPQQSAVGAAPTAADAVRAFATTYINWTASTVARTMARLAERSVGQARSAAALAASETAGDYELQRGGVANQGTVEVVAPLPGGGDEYVVVTLERTTATNTSAYDGLRPAWHVTLATVQRQAGRWVLSGWQPES